MAESTNYSSPIATKYLQADIKTACSECPAAMWYLMGVTLKCFCTKVHSVVYDPDEAALELITECDGQILSTAEVQG